MPPPTANEFFQIAIFLASTCAAGFWLSSATGADCYTALASMASLRKSAPGIDCRSPS
jgi:hypothetical protein